jgi:hypothetical protein
MKRLHLKANRVTIIVPKELLDATRKKAALCKTDFSSYIALALLRTLHDESFAIDLMLSNPYLDHQFDLCDKNQEKEAHTS